MKKFQRKTQKGFTLIELLIVIALLGALAVGLLAALDPFEQLKKGTDTGTRNTVSEIQGGAIRYYAIANQMPWNPTGAASATLSWQTAASAYVTAISPIVVAGELKNDFSTLAGNQLSNIYMVGDAQTITVCFQPTSKSFRSDKNSKFQVSGGTVTAVTDFQTSCANHAGDTVGTGGYNCYWCIN